MKGKIVFRSSVMGFNKQDVILYMSKMNERFNQEKEKSETQLMDELKKNEELQNRLEELRQQNFLLQQTTDKKNGPENEQEAAYPLSFYEVPKPYRPASLETAEDEEEGEEPQTIAYVDETELAQALESEDEDFEPEVEAVTSDEEALEAEPEPEPEYKPEPEYEPEPEPEYKREPEYKPEPEPVPEPEPEPEYKREPEYKPEPEPEPVPEYKPKPEYKPEPEPEPMVFRTSGGSYRPAPDIKPAQQISEPEYKSAAYRPIPEAKPIAIEPDAAVYNSYKHHEKITRMDEIIEQLNQVKAGEDQIISRIETLLAGQKSSPAPAAREELHTAPAARYPTREGKEDDKIQSDFEAYLQRVKGELETFHTRVKNSKNNTSRRIDQLEQELAGLVDSMGEMDRVMGSVIEGIMQSFDGKEPK